MLDMSNIKNKNELLTGLVRNDFRTFLNMSFKTIENKVLTDGINIDVMTNALTRVSEIEESIILILNMPPRSLKSFACTVCYSAWLLGKDPNLRIMIISYGEELTKDFLSKIKIVMSSKWYKAAFPNCKISKKAEVHIATSKGGYIRGLSLGATMTGLGADYIIIDDPIKAQESQSKIVREGVVDKFKNAIYSRLNDKKRSKILLVMQRMHQNDLTGAIQEMSLKQTKIIPIPAYLHKEMKITFGNKTLIIPKGPLQPERKDAESLEATKKIMGEYLYEAQYMQNPLPAAGNIFKRKWLKYEALEELNTKQYLKVWSWDTASTANDNSDYSVGTYWCFKNEKRYLLAVVRVKMEYQELLKLILEKQKVKPADITLVEKANIGVAVQSELSIQGHVSLSISPCNSKEDRAITVTPELENGNVLINDGIEHKSDFEEELLGFPNCKNDDIVDSVTQALYYAQKLYLLKPYVLGEWQEWS